MLGDIPQGIPPPPASVLPPHWPPCRARRALPGTWGGHAHPSSADPRWLAAGLHVAGVLLFSSVLPCSVPSSSQQ